MLVRLRVGASGRIIESRKSVHVSLVQSPNEHAVGEYVCTMLMSRRRRAFLSGFCWTEIVAQELSPVGV